METGQLDDMFMYDQNVKGLKFNDKRAEAATDLETINSLNLDDKTQAKKAQEILNKYGAGLKGTGVFGPKSNEALKQVEQLATMSDEDFTATNKEGYINNYVSKLAAPYSVAKSYKEMDRELQAKGRTLESEIDLHRAKKDIDAAAFMFDGQSISMNMGPLMKNGLRGITEGIEAQKLKIDQLTAARKKAEESGAVNVGEQLDNIDKQIRWEQAKLEQINNSIVSGDNE
jgi:hypothetical protein